MKHIVIAECVDARTGSRYFPGDTFPDPEPQQAVRLTAARCLAPSDSDQAKAAVAAAAERAEAAEQKAAAKKAPAKKAAGK